MRVHIGKNQRGLAEVLEHVRIDDLIVIALIFVCPAGPQIHRFPQADRGKVVGVATGPMRLDFQAAQIAGTDDRLRIVVGTAAQQDEIEDQDGPLKGVGALCRRQAQDRRQVRVADLVPLVQGAGHAAERVKFSDDGHGRRFRQE